MKKTSDSDVLLDKRNRICDILVTADPDRIKNVCLVLEALSMSQVLEAVVQASSTASR